MHLTVSESLDWLICFLTQWLIHAIKIVMLRLFGDHEIFEASKVLKDMSAAIYDAAGTVAADQFVREPKSFEGKIWAPNAMTCARISGGCLWIRRSWIHEWWSIISKCRYARISPYNELTSYEMPTAGGCFVFEGSTDQSYVGNLVTKHLWWLKNLANGYFCSDWLLFYAETIIKQFQAAGIVSNQRVDVKVMPALIVRLQVYKINLGSSMQRCSIRDIAKAAQKRVGLPLMHNPCWISTARRYSPLTGKLKTIGVCALPRLTNHTDTLSFRLPEISLVARNSRDADGFYKTVSSVKLP